MSESLGAVNYDGQRGAKFIDTPFMNERGPHSEETAQKIDAEVMRIITDAHNEARKLLRDRRDILDELASRLLDKEVVEGDELRALLGPVPPKQPDTIPAVVEAPVPREV